MDFLSLLLFSAFSLAADAKCTNQCQLVYESESEEYTLTCACAGRPVLGERDWKLGRATANRNDFLRKKFVGVSLEKYPEIVNNSCRGLIGPEEKSFARKKVELSKLPICECVSAQQQFFHKRSCRTTPAGEVNCDFDLKFEDARNHLPEPTLYSYQVCLTKAETYRKPASCPASPCDAKVPFCSNGETLKNIADPESCCPIFVCEQKKGEDV